MMRAAICMNFIGPLEACTRIRSPQRCRMAPGVRQQQPLAITLLRRPRSSWPSSPDDPRIGATLGSDSFGIWAAARTAILSRWSKPVSVTDRHCPRSSRPDGGHGQRARIPHIAPETSGSPQEVPSRTDILMEEFRAVTRDPRASSREAPTTVEYLLRPRAIAADGPRMEATNEYWRSETRVRY